VFVDYSHVARGFNGYLAYHNKTNNHYYLIEKNFAEEVMVEDFDNRKVPQHDV
jgi:hypothetical protein